MSPSSPLHHPRSRRWLLRSAAGALALPLLGSLAPRSARADLTPPKRLLVMWVPNGWVQSLYTPTGQGTTWQTSPIMAPLEAIRSKVLCLSGLDNRPGIYPERYDEHSACTGATLTASHLDGTSLVSNGGWSVDQILAEQLGSNTPFPSLQVGSEAPLRCYTPDRCPGFVTISWRGRDAPMTKDTSVTSVFNRLFQGLDPSLDPTTRARRETLEQSLIDRLHGDLSRYRSDVGTLDARRLDQYLTGLRGLENRLQIHRTQQLCDASYVPSDPADPTERIRAMADLITLSFQCDQTRIVTWMLGTGRSERSLKFLGYSATHHELSHEDESWAEAHTAIGRWEVEQLVYMVQRLAETPEADGSSMLDHTTVLFLSGIGEGGRHDPLDMNVLLAGGSSPALGQRLVYPPGTPLGNLYVSLLQKFGVEQEQFGDDGVGSLLTL
jgi:hypothetical protein